MLQAAASNQFKECYGVEKADTPAECAVRMEKEFKKWMDWFGKIYTDFTVSTLYVIQVCFVQTFIQILL